MIFVDQPRHYPNAPARHRHKRWCHMWTDGDPEELHKMAAALGLQRSWYQDHKTLPHYDITEPKRVKAMALGARYGNPRLFIMARIVRTR